MGFKTRVVYWVIRAIITLLFRVDEAQFEHIPEGGPLIMVTNHVNIMEIPILYVHLQPRKVTAFIKFEQWDNAITNFLLTLWEAIPVRRGEPDIKAFRIAQKMLEEGFIVAIAPEGTRSGHGRLQPPHAGVVPLALHSGAALLPVVYYGHEGWQGNVKRLRRTDFHVAVGRPFRLEARGETATREVREKMLDEVMYQLAALLPEANRGVYANLEAATTNYLSFERNEAEPEKGATK